MARSSPLLSQISDTFQIIPSCEHTENKSGWEKVIGDKTNINKWNYEITWEIVAEDCGTKLYVAQQRDCQKKKDLSLILTWMEDIFRGPSINKIKFFVVLLNSACWSYGLLVYP